MLILRSLQGLKSLYSLNFPTILLAMSMSTAKEILQVKRLSDNAFLPVRGSEHAAGFDLSSAYDDVVPARGKALIKLDLAFAIPEFTYARIGNCNSLSSSSCSCNSDLNP